MARETVYAITSNYFFKLILGGLQPKDQMVAPFYTVWHNQLKVLLGDSLQLTGLALIRLHSETDETFFMVE